MLSTREFFYGHTEPVWVLRAEKKDESRRGADDQRASSSSRKGHENAGHPIVPRATAMPQVHSSPEYIPTRGKEEGAKGKTVSDDRDRKKEMAVVMKVPICCSGCEDSVKVALYGLKGVKSVDCIIHIEKVTVVTSGATATDILLECRKVFKHSKMWRDDDTR